MSSGIYLCSQCKALFESPVLLDPAEGKGAECPYCRSRNVEELNIGSCPLAPPASEILTWEFLCHQCETRFETSVPRGPREEKEIKCPECGSKDIERVDICSFEICPPGG